MKKRTAAIVLAAGQGKRMGTKTAKQFLLLNERPVLFYALKAFEDSEIDDVILVTSESEIEYCKKEIVEAYGFQKVRAVLSGGKERYHSVAMGLRGIKSLSDQMNCELVLIHDGARPLVSTELIHEMIEQTREYGACVTGTPVKDTVKIADENGFCNQTPNRNLVWTVQTPQAFSFSMVSDAYELLLEKEQDLLAQGVVITDDAMVVEYMTDYKVKLVKGDYRNIKLTTPEDLEIAGLWLAEKQK